MFKFSTKLRIFFKNYLKVAISARISSPPTLELSFFTATVDFVNPNICGCCARSIPPILVGLSREKDLKLTGGIRFSKFSQLFEQNLIVSAMARPLSLSLPKLFHITRNITLVFQVFLLSQMISQFLSDPS